MVRVDANDYEVDDSVIELINAFSAALFDKDRLALDDVNYLACDKVSSKCSCYEPVCICERR